MLNTADKLNVEALDRYSRGGPIEVRYDLLESTPGRIELASGGPLVYFEVRSRWCKDVLTTNERARERIRCGVLTTCGGVA